ncbi:hypothetical protein Slin15195_G119460 [Septoria linicola]|uniref:Uncharacterized protein n=1 Tax=Septoria linicola TaxID=215465 RepID=A0A9Q9AZ18_9PEZI|nr:hypothetical protein Slin14017_G096450 [Septoria linicola]USW58627.1 hypothetical protein Slin15195_G119460 [Septoria linicola]
MGIFAQLKKKKASEKRQAADIAAEQPLVAATHGNFGAGFTIIIRYVSFGADTTMVANLCYTSSQGFVPFLAYTGYNGFGKGCLTLHSTTNEHQAPLAIVENVGGRLKSAKALRLPSQGGELPNVVGLEDKGSLTKERYRFAIALALAGSAQVETFEWRPVSLYKFPMLRHLHRVGSLVEGGEEIVASYVEEKDPKKAGGKLGELKFEGRGATDEFGGQRRLVAALSAVTLCQIQIIAKQSMGVLGESFGAAVGLGGMAA